MTKSESFRSSCESETARSKLERCLMDFTRCGLGRLTLRTGTHGRIFWCFWGRCLGMETIRVYNGNGEYTDFIVTIPTLNSERPFLTPGDSKVSDYVTFCEPGPRAKDFTPRS